MRFNKTALLAILLAGAAAPAASSDGKVVAVLSSASGVYLQAFAAFQEAYGEKVPVFDLSEGRPKIPAGTVTVVTFGTKAASRSYSDGVNLVYALAPGYFSEGETGDPARVKVCMTTSPENLLSRISQLHPNLKRLHIFWRSPGFSRQQSDYEQAGMRAGIKVSAIKVAADDHIPTLLRSSVGQADAFWLPPDPLLVSNTTLAIFRQFARANKVPIYVSTEGLARKGACAAIGPSFTQVGQAAAKAVKDLQAGVSLPPVMNSDVYRTTLNLSEAKNCGLVFSAEAVKSADEFYP